MGWRIADAAAARRLGLHAAHLLNYEYVTNRIIYIDELTLLDKLDAWSRC